PAPRRRPPPRARQGPQSTVCRGDARRWSWASPFTSRCAAAANGGPPNKPLHNNSQSRRVLPADLDAPSIVCPDGAPAYAPWGRRRLQTKTGRRGRRPPVLVTAAYRRLRRAACAFFLRRTLGLS